MDVLETTVSHIFLKLLDGFHFSICELISSLDNIFFMIGGDDLHSNNDSSDKGGGSGGAPVSNVTSESKKSEPNKT